MEKRPVDVVVMSDLHLGTYGCRAKEIVNYLKSIAPQILILNGDIIDGWQFSKRYFPSAHLTVIKEIMNMLAIGTRVIYITGNHDEMLRRYSDIQLGNFQLTDKLVIEINNKMTWIFHGDVFDNTTKGSAKTLAKLGSTGYALLIAANKMVNSFLKLFGKERLSFSKAIMKGVNKAIVKMHEFEQTAAELAIEKKYDYVICGHIHQPEKKLIETKNGSVMYLNSGDWVEHLTALEYSHNDWHIYQYNEKEFTNAKSPVITPVLNVVTDEVNFYINSLAI
jgi:UDP-2,3-diacylglucosamine pyrophosphatase LpxH